MEDRRQLKQETLMEAEHSRHERDRGIGDPTLQKLQAEAMQKSGKALLETVKMQRGFLNNLSVLRERMKAHDAAEQHENVAELWRTTEDLEGLAGLFGQLAQGHEDLAEAAEAVRENYRKHLQPAGAGD